MCHRCNSSPAHYAKSLADNHLWLPAFLVFAPGLTAGNLAWFRDSPTDETGTSLQDVPVTPTRALVQLAFT